MESHNKWRLKFGCVVVGILAAGFAPLPHPIHVAFTELSFNPESQKFEAAHKLFAEDIELTIKRFLHVETNIGLPTQHPDLDSILAEYLNAQFQVRTQGSAPLTFKPVGMEIKDDGSVWVYVESERVAVPHRIAVENRILMELYEDQRNLLNWVQAGQIKSFSFVRGDGPISIEYESRKAYKIGEY